MTSHASHTFFGVSRVPPLPPRYRQQHEHVLPRLENRYSLWEAMKKLSLFSRKKILATEPYQTNNLEPNPKKNNTPSCPTPTFFQNSPILSKKDLSLGLVFFLTSKNFFPPQFSKGLKRMILRPKHNRKKIASPPTMRSDDVSPRFEVALWPHQVLVPMVECSTARRFLAFGTHFSGHKMCKEKRGKQNKNKKDTKHGGEKVEVRRWVGCVSIVLGLVAKLLC